jgi:hypothetical protein
MGDPGAENIYDNQSNRSSPEIEDGNKMCPSYLSDMSNFNCNSILKNNVRPKIMDQPQIHNSKIEFLLLVIVMPFNSFPQLFQLFN